MINYLKDIIKDNVVLEPKIQYKDFAEWQMAQKETDEYKISLKKWRDKLKTSKIVEFTDHGTSDLTGDTLRIILSPEIMAKLNIQLEKQGLTEFMYLLSVFYLILSRVDENQTITIGTPVSGRNHPDIEDGLGMYINTLLLMMKLEGRDSVVDYMQKVKEMVLDGLVEQHVQLDDIVEVLKQAGVNTQLFNVLFSYEKETYDSIQLNDEITLKPIKMTMLQAKVDLTLAVVSSNKGIELNFDFATEQMDLEYVKKFSEEYLSVLEQLLDNQGQSIESIEYRYDLRNSKLQQMDEVLEEFDGEFAF
jgi:iturin family lipopeptide synthetase A